HRPRRYRGLVPRGPLPLPPGVGGGRHRRVPRLRQPAGALALDRRGALHRGRPARLRPADPAGAGARRGAGPRPREGRRGMRTRAVLLGLVAGLLAHLLLVAAAAAVLATVTAPHAGAQAPPDDAAV